LTDLTGAPWPLDEVRGDDTATDPTAHMRKQAAGNQRGRLSFITGASAKCQPIENPLLKIDKGMTEVAVWR